MARKSRIFCLGSDAEQLAILGPKLLRFYGCFLTQELLKVPSVMNPFLDKSECTMFWRPHSQQTGLSFVLISSCIPEESLPGLYVLCTSLGMLPHEYKPCLLSASSLPEVHSYCVMKGDSSGGCQGKEIYPVMSACLN